METEAANHTHLATLFVCLKTVKNFVIATLYFLAAHMYDGLCYAVSNIVSYPMAIFIMTAILFSASAVLVFLHDELREHFLWDILDINRINTLTNTNSIAKYRLIERLMRWAVQKGHWWIHVIGSATIGPPVVTLLLRKKGNWKSSLFYLISGTLISVIIWVTIWAGVGKLTWNHYVKPFIQNIID